MKLIELHSRKHPRLFTQVDNEDYEWLNKYRWNIVDGRNGVFYAVTVPSQGKIPLHQMILINVKEVDHIDHNGLNNQRSNLRAADRSTNQMNKRKSLNKSSLYKGVSWNKRNKNWRVSIRINKKKIYLGYFINEVDAAQAYDKKAKELFGEYAYLNFRDK